MTHGLKALPIRSLPTDHGLNIECAWVQYWYLRTTQCTDFVHACLYGGLLRGILVNPYSQVMLVLMDGDDRSYHEKPKSVFGR